MEVDDEGALTPKTSAMAKGMTAANYSSAKSMGVCVPFPSPQPGSSLMCTSVKQCLQILERHVEGLILQEAQQASSKEEGPDPVAFHGTDGYVCPLFRLIFQCQLFDLEFQ